MAIADVEALLAQKAREQPRIDPWKIRLWRTERGMSLANVIDAGGWSPNSRKGLNRIEVYGNPTELCATRIARAIGIPIEYVLSDSAQWERNRLTYLAWVAAGRPPVAEWLLARCV